MILGYVEEAAALAFLYSIAEALEDKAMDRARGGLRALLKLVPGTATVRREGTSVEVAAKDLTVGQVMLVRPGERIATDGVVVSGRSSLDTSAITGESIPVEVEPGDDAPRDHGKRSTQLEGQGRRRNSIGCLGVAIERCEVRHIRAANLAGRAWDGSCKVWRSTVWAARCAMLAACARQCLNLGG